MCDEKCPIQFGRLHAKLNIIYTPLILNYNFTISGLPFEDETNQCSRLCQLFTFSMLDHEKREKISGNPSKSTMAEIYQGDLQYNEIVTKVN